jgi:hypothetical protein
MMKRQNTCDWITLVSVLPVVLLVGHFAWGLYANNESNREWGLLQSARRERADQPISDLEFEERNGRHLLCVRGIAGTRIWMLLDAEFDGYKQLPPDEQFDLKDQDYFRIKRSAPVTPVVSRCLRSHIVNSPR